MSVVPCREQVESELVGVMAGRIARPVVVPRPNLAHALGTATASYVPYSPDSGAAGRGDVVEDG